MTLRLHRFYTLIGIVLIAGGVLTAIYPFFPTIQYRLTHLEAQPKVTPFAETDFAPNEPSSSDTGTSSGDTQKGTDAQANSSSVATAAKFHNTLQIKKIGVNIPIVEGSVSALERGAWRLPLSATPDHIGNTILSAHRYKYLPPSSKTFYLLDKLQIGDTFTVEWGGKTYRYGIDKREIRDASDLEMLQDTYDRRVTLLTCYPLFSTKQRLIVSGRLLK